MFALEIINAINKEGAREWPIQRRLRGDAKNPWPRQVVICDNEGRLVGLLDRGVIPFTERCNKD